MKLVVLESSPRASECEPGLENHGFMSKCFRRAPEQGQQKDFSLFTKDASLRWKDSLVPPCVHHHLIISGEMLATSQHLAGAGVVTKQPLSLLELRLCGWTGLYPRHHAKPGTLHTEQWGGPFLAVTHLHGEQFDSIHITEEIYVPLYSPRHRGDRSEFDAPPSPMKVCKKVINTSQRLGRMQIPINTRTGK